MVLDTRLVGKYNYAVSVWNSSGTGKSDFAPLNSAYSQDTDAIGRTIFTVCNNGSNAVFASMLVPGGISSYTASGIVNYSNFTSITISNGANSSIPTDCWFKFYGIK